MGTRLIVKNLPPSITENKLREKFAACAEGCEITDVKLKYTPEGVFRRFGFVGFVDPEHASKALKYLHGTYFGTQKCSVEICQDLGKVPKRNKDKNAVEAEEPSKKQETKLSVHAENKNRDIKKIIEKYKTDVKFQEFLRLHKNNSSKWSPEEILKLEKDYDKSEKSSGEDNDEQQESEEDSCNEDKKLAEDSGVSDLDYLKSLIKNDDENKSKPPKEPKNELYFTVKLTDLPYQTRKKHIKEFFKSVKLKPKSIRVPRNVKGIAYAGFASEKDMKIALSRNKSILLGHSVKVSKFVDKTQKKQESIYPQNGNEESVISDSGRLFLRNLSYTVNEEDLEGLFKKYGPLTEVNLPIDKTNRKSKGFAFVTFMFPEHALTAFTELDGSTFQGRLLHIIPGKPKEGDDVDDDKNRNRSFKDKKKLMEKQSATSSHNWNTLFLGTSAVADLVSDKYNVSKKDVLLGDGSQTAAVRLALGETQIVADTKAFLEEQGVSLEAFDGDPRKMSRSKTVILIKNLPMGVPVEEIRDKFAKFGSLGRVILPPNCVTALVEFHEPSEARGAFRGLAYSKFRDTPLFLEFAPEGALNPNDAPPPTVEESPTVPQYDEGDEEEEPEPETTLFVKNLNFSTTESKLREHFQPMGAVHEVTIAKKKDNVEGLLSMGFGFVRFKKKASADKALKLLQHKMLEDHSLELKKSERVSESHDSKSTRKSTNKDIKESPKILVRNIPFEAHKKEIEDLFKTFGQLKFVRLPKKVTGSHRGFAFVEYHTVEEAKKAFKALSFSTHLYGRRLVLEWAEQEESLENLRQKASREADIFENHTSSKRLKKSDLLDFMEKPKGELE